PWPAAAGPTRIIPTPPPRPERAPRGEAPRPAGRLHPGPETSLAPVRPEQREHDDWPRARVHCRLAGHEDPPRAGAICDTRALRPTGIALRAAAALDDAVRRTADRQRGAGRSHAPHPPHSPSRPRPSPGSGRYRPRERPRTGNDTAAARRAPATGAGAAVPGGRRRGTSGSDLPVPRPPGARPWCATATVWRQPHVRQRGCATPTPARTGDRRHAPLRGQPASLRYGLVRHAPQRAPC